MAAQILSGKGYRDVYNLSGGIKAWDKEVAVGPVDQGLELFSGEESVETALSVAYGLEMGLEDFYTSMIPRVGNGEVKGLFKKLADIERLHQERIFKAYLHASGQSISRDEFVAGHVTPALEGGLTSEDYVQMFRPDFESVVDVVSLAMSIEAQAMDLYQRAAGNSSDEQTRQALVEIADEERIHLTRLGRLMDDVA